MDEKHRSENLTVEETKELKLSDYAVQTTDRILAGVHLEMYALGKEGHTAVETLEKIVTEWDDDQTIADFQRTLGNLANIAEGKGDDASALELNQKRSGLDVKAEKARTFKDSLRSGGLFGQLIGAELLKTINSHPDRLSDPIIQLGTDYVLSKLNEEKERDELMKLRPDFNPQFLAFTDGTLEAIKEIDQFKKALVEKQSPQKSLI